MVITLPPDLQKKQDAAMPYLRTEGLKVYFAPNTPQKIIDDFNEVLDAMDKAQEWANESH